MKDTLALYRKKRDFAVTPEPADGGRPGVEALQYVIHKHWARSLHYDLRLEIDGAMKSWAVPKGPSYDPADKRMAVQVEDHPLSYNAFEGHIPANQYGAGRVIVWDRGYWVPIGDPGEGYRQGKLKFTLHGHKLQGRWTLVRMHGRGSEKQPAWLLIKERDGLERSSGEFDVVQAMPDSVASAPAIPAPLSSDAQADRRPAKLPPTLAPQLATLVDAPPHDAAQWDWELKFDGYRVLARIERGKVRLLTRNGNDWTEKMPTIAQAVALLPLRSGWIDGEVLVLDSHGVPDFQALQNAFDGRSTGNLVYYVFDLPYADGRDLRALPLAERRTLLRAAMERAPSHHVRFSESFEAPPGALIASACRLGFEGVIGKRRNSVYASERSADWIKLKCGHRQEFVVCGYTDPQGSRTGFGSLLLGVHDDQGVLRYAGNVGTGFNERALKELIRRLRPLRSGNLPFPQSPAAGGKAHGVEPRLVAEVSFSGWTQEGKVRHAVFRGLRDDKPAQAIVREKPQHLAPSSPKTLANADVQVSNPQRVIDPHTGLTKIDLVRYYATIAPLLLPHLKGRPVSLVRAPEGVDGALFFQKHLEAARMKGVRQLAQGLYPDHPPLLEVATPQGLASAAQMNTVEFHTWNARKDRIDRPDRMTFDLDPGEGVAWTQVQEGTTLVHTLLAELGLSAWLKTSGGKGLHIVVPIKRLHGWDTVKGFSQAIVQHLASTLPDRFVAKSGPRNRVGKIFVDYLRNGFGATTASAWTARARPGMGVSVPVAWSELDMLTGSAHWTVQNIGKRLPTGNSPWQGYEAAAVSIATAMKMLGYRPGG